MWRAVGGPERLIAALKISAALRKAGVVADAASMAMGMKGMAGLSFAFAVRRPDFYD